MVQNSKPKTVLLRSRSPRYPGIPLEVAIERAKLVYTHEKRHPAPVAAIVGHWDYTPGSSSANVSVAALKSYGLLLDEGSGENRLLRLSDLALDIILNPEPVPSIHRAALMPRMHREMFDKYGNSLPSNASLKHELITQRGFTDGGATDFINQYRKTLAFARLPDQSTAADHEDDPMLERDPQPDGTAQHVQVTHQPTQQLALPPGMTIPIPLTGGTPVYITGQFPISEAAWQQLLRVLDAMKPGLVAGAEIGLPNS